MSYKLKIIKTKHKFLFQVDKINNTLLSFFVTIIYIYIYHYLSLKTSITKEHKVLNSFSIKNNKT